MMKRIHIQVLDNPVDDMFYEEYATEVETNRILTSELSKEMKYFFASVVFVEYVDLFMDNEEEFDDIRELLRIGAVKTPVVLINGALRIHGGIPSAVIRQEVEKIISDGQIH